MSDSQLQEILFKTLRRCSHELEDSVVAERLATAVIMMEAAVEAEEARGG